MSLLNSVLGAVLSKGLGGGGGNSQQDLIGSVIGGLLQQSGGAGGVLDMFRKAGHAQEADSWQSTGQNLPIGGADLMKVLGSVMGGAGAAQQSGGGGLGGMLGGLLGGGQQAPQAGMGGLEQILAQSGMDQSQFGDLLAKALPQVLDGMTPGGQVQDQSPDLMQSVLGSVLKNIGR